MRPEFLDRGPVEAIGHGSKTGWICEDSFMEWFSHFLHHVQPNARPHPTLLLADGHASHTNNLQLIERARQNNVTLLIFPSHCTHKLQAATYLMLLLGLHMMDELLLLNMMYKNHVSKFSPIFLKRWLDWQLQSLDVEKCMVLLHLSWRLRRRDNLQMLTVTVMYFRMLFLSW